MKYILFFSVVTVIIMLFSANNPKVNFDKDSNGGILFHKGNWNEALDKAGKENKTIFLDIYATWCGPCKKLKANTFSNEDVGSFYNTNFINVAMDGEKGEGLELARKYGVTGYPTLIFINSSGKVITGTSGYHNAKAFLALGKKIIKNNSQ